MPDIRALKIGQEIINRYREYETVIDLIQGLYHR